MNQIATEDASTGALEGARQYLYESETFKIPKLDSSVRELEKLVEKIEEEVRGCDGFGDTTLSLFQETDHAKNGYLTKMQFVPFIRQLFAQTIKREISKEQA